MEIKFIIVGWRNDGQGDLVKEFHEYDLWWTSEIKAAKRFDTYPECEEIIKNWIASPLHHNKKGSIYQIEKIFVS